MRRADNHMEAIQYWQPYRVRRLVFDENEECLAGSLMGLVVRHQRRGRLSKVRSPYHHL